MARLAILLMLTASTLFASTNDAAWRAGLDFFASELPRRHVSLFAVLPRTTFEAEVHELRDEVPSLADHEIVAGLLRIVTSIGDSHTTIYPQNFRRFPVTLHWFSDGLYVTRASAEHRDLIGARLVAIEGRAAHPA